MSVFSGGKSGSFHRESDEAEEIFLNLTPMIDVLTCLLFFLLLSFGAVIIALVNASVPVTTDGQADSATQPTAVVLGIQISAKEISVSASSDTLKEDELKALMKSFPEKKGTFDYRALNDYVYGVKRRFRASKTVVITPDSDIPYEILVNVMDASRDREAKQGKRIVRMPLFPEAVVSTMAK
jgi:biopolymer transport protein TolR